MVDNEKREPFTEGVRVFHYQLYLFQNCHTAKV